MCHSFWFHFSCVFVLFHFVSFYVFFYGYFHHLFEPTWMRCVCVSQWREYWIWIRKYHIMLSTFTQLPYRIILEWHCHICIACTTVVLSEIKALKKRRKNRMRNMVQNFISGILICSTWTALVSTIEWCKNMEHN